MAKVYVHTDIEGIAGYVFFMNTGQSMENVAHLQRMNHLLTQEVKAACTAALDWGADEVWVNDSHGFCYNILFEELPKQCQIMHGRPGCFDAWLSCFDGSVDALVSIGMHAMAGTPHAVCPHSRWHINGTLALSEATMAAALAGYHRVPCVCVSGDDQICREVNDKIPACETVVVKWGIAAQNARSLMPAAACERIYRGVTAGLQRAADIPPYVIPGPYRLNISDRDPEVTIFPEDIAGDDLWETVHRALNSTTYGHYGQDAIDDRSYRWPA
jgi:D-amino peptidase